HIGVRLMATVLLGEENETRPADLLDARLSWIAFAGMQLALALCVYGASSGAAGFVLAGALCGFCAWLAMPANMIAVRLNVRHALRTVV
ncbi:MAG: hypothetical protein ABI282_08385, partial [Candidatus Baltobacteraceae bacterium]